MKHTTLRRKTPLRSRKPVRRKRQDPRRVPAEYRDPDYLAWLRVQQCRVPGCCSSTAVEAHHLRFDATGASLGSRLKDDRRAISLCRLHHLTLHVEPWRLIGTSTENDLRAWQDRQLAVQRAEYLATRERAA